ncbi:MAG: PilZ domain-containing protein [Gammaproteobacteria bacterium]|nr:PilZ domain-containing protein [Gammaproteobacteria bacterium]
MACRFARHAELFRIPLRGVFRACSMSDISLGGFNVVAAHRMKIGNQFEVVSQTRDTMHEHRIEGIVVNHRQISDGRVLYKCKRRSELDSSLIEYIVKKTLNRNLALRAIFA